MPAYAHIEPVLAGRGSLYRYEGTEKWYYRQLRPGERRYINRIIPGATTLDEARAGVIDVAFKLQGELTQDSTQQQTSDSAPVPALQRRRSTKHTPTILNSINEWLAEQEKQVEIGSIQAETLRAKRITFSHLVRYLQSIDIVYCKDITINTFTDYPLFRKDNAKLTIKKELSQINEWITNHLIRNKLVSTDVALEKNLVPSIKVRQDELVANPAINPDDWMLMNRWIRNWVKQGKGGTRPQIHMWRVNFWTFTMCMKNSGLRPNELLALKWKHVQHENIGREASDGSVKDEWVTHLYIARSKTARSRLVPTNKNVTKRLLYWRLYLDSYLTNRGKNKKVEPDDLVFGQPDRDFIGRHYKLYLKAWWRMMGELKGKLTGNRFSDKNYTIYSMRSTYIENQLAAGVSIHLVARACGHSIAVLERHYDRMDIQRRARELTAIEYGKKRMD